MEGTPAAARYRASRSSNVTREGSSGDVRRTDERVSRRGKRRRDEDDDEQIARNVRPRGPDLSAWRNVERFSGPGRSGKRKRQMDDNEEGRSVRQNTGGRLKFKKPQRRMPAKGARRLKK